MKIEKNVEVVGEQVARKYPFSDLNIEDSFSIGRVGSKQANALRSAASKYAIRNNKKFIVRKMENETRCWRVG